MSERELRSRSFIGPAVIGVLVGAVLAGAPLGYFVSTLKNQHQATSEAASKATAAAQANIVRLQSELETSRSLAAAAGQALEIQRAVNTESSATTARELTEQRALVEELSKPEIPLQLSVRKGLVDAGYVLMIRNPTAQDIIVAAFIQSPTGQAIQRRLVISANLGKNIGESEGWAFTSRDTVTLKSPGYQDLIYMIPQY